MNGYDLLIREGIGSIRQLLLSRVLLEDLEYPEVLQFAVDGNYLYIGEKIPGAEIECTYNYNSRGLIAIHDDVLNYIATAINLNLNRSGTRAVRISKTADDVYDKKYNGELLRCAKIKMCG